MPNKTFQSVQEPNLICIFFGNPSDFHLFYFLILFLLFSTFFKNAGIEFMQVTQKSCCPNFPPTLKFTPAYSSLSAFLQLSHERLNIQILYTPRLVSRPFLPIPESWFLILESISYSATFPPSPAKENRGKLMNRFRQQYLWEVREKSAWWFLVRRNKERQALKSS